jgi:hypothetical protein
VRMLHYNSKQLFKGFIVIIDESFNSPKIKKKYMYMFIYIYTRIKPVHSYGILAVFNCLMPTGHYN